VTDSRQSKDRADFLPFEGVWLLNKYPTGGLACGRTVNGKLFIPFSLSEQKKAVGHCYDCQVVDGKLFCRFEHFDSATSGALCLTVGPNHTLTGGRWLKDQIPDPILQNISKLSDSLPGKQNVVWIRIQDKEVPASAQKYFTEDWPNKNEA
jgi:hypothetical protein